MTPQSIQRLYDTLLGFKNNGLTTLVIGGGGLGDMVVVKALAQAVQKQHDTIPIVVFPSDTKDGDGNKLISNVFKGYVGPIITEKDIHPTIVLDLCDKLELRSFDWKFCVNDSANPLSQHWLPYYLRYPGSTGGLADMGWHFEQLALHTSGLDIKDEYSLRVDPCKYTPRQSYVTLHCEPAGLPNHKGFWWQVEELTDKLFESFGIMTHILGVSHDRLPKGCLDSRGLSINSSASMIKGAVAHIDCDSGLHYVAHAVGQQSIVFWSCTPHRFLEWQDDLNLYQEEPPCLPCFFVEQDWWWECKKRWPHCENMLHIEHVWDRIKEWIEGRVKEKENTDDS